MLIQTIKALTSGQATFRDVLITFLIVVPIVLISLTVHEFSHGYASYLLGDNTARNYGRLTLNPLKHLDPMGALCMLLFGFGWAKPCPVNPRYYKHPRSGMAITAAAGPLSNIILAFLNVLFFNLFSLIPVSDSGFGATVIAVGCTFFYLMAEMNVYLAVFNLLPIPPLDGSRVAFIFLPTKAYFGVMKYERYIMIAMFALLWLGVFDGTIGWLADRLFFGMNWLITRIPIFG